MEKLFWYKLMIIPNASLSYRCHLYFLGVAFICTWNLACLELEDLSCCSRISKHTVALAVTRMKECFIFIYHKYFSFKKRWNKRWQKELGSGRWRPCVSWKQKAINLFSVALLFPDLCHFCAVPNHTFVAACSITVQHCMSQYMLKSHVFSKQTTPAASELLSNCLLKASITVLYGEAQITT